MMIRGLRTAPKSATSAPAQGPDNINTAINTVVPIYSDNNTTTTNNNDNNNNTNNYTHHHDDDTTNTTNDNNSADRI